MTENGKLIFLPYSFSPSDERKREIEEIGGEETKKKGRKRLRI
jgi:hypothetical protein